MVSPGGRGKAQRAPVCRKLCLLWHFRGTLRFAPATQGPASHQMGDMSHEPIGNLGRRANRSWGTANETNPTLCGDATRAG